MTYGYKISRDTLDHVIDIKNANGLHPMHVGEVMSKI